MIKALELAIEKVKKLPRERQEYASEVLEQIAEAGDEVYILSDEERRLVREGLAELDRGETATDEEVRTVSPSLARKIVHDEVARRSGRQGA